MNQSYRLATKNKFGVDKMTRYILLALIAYILGQNLWAYPTIDGMSFGFAKFGYHYSYNSNQ